MLKRVSTRNLLIFSAMLAGMAILAVLFLLHTWSQDQFALKIQAQNAINYRSFQIALESEFQKNRRRAQLLGEEPAISTELAGIYYGTLLGRNTSNETLRKHLLPYWHKMAAQEVQPELSIHLPGELEAIIELRGGWSHSKHEPTDPTILNQAFETEMLTKGLEKSPSGVTISIVEPLYAHRANAGEKPLIGFLRITS
jgi:hypothetical protein